MKIEIVTHCWSGSSVPIYHHLLELQFRSLLLADTLGVKITHTTCLDFSDVNTREVFVELSKRLRRHGVKPKFIALSRSELFRRAIGRNFAAKETRSDVVWFTDCDYLFPGKCLREAAIECIKAQSPMVHPQVVNIHRTHECGDRMIESVREGSPVEMRFEDNFIPRKENRAIGGIQIVPGHVAREHGYCDWPKMQRPVDGDLMSDTKSDRAFRVHLGTNGTPIDLPGVYRIRHSTSGLNRGKGGVERFTGN